MLSIETKKTSTKQLRLLNGRVGRKNDGRNKIVVTLGNGALL